MKDLMVRIILIVIFLVLYVGMNNEVSGLLVRQDGMDIALKHGQSLWVGMGRWMSHVNWMLLLQKRATISGKPDPAVAGALYKRYDTTTNLDPFLVTAYEHGGVELATIGAPKRGLELLDKGIDVVGDENWKLPAFAAQIVTQYCKDDKDAQDKARKYWEQAKKGKGHPFYIESALVRIQSAGIQDDPVAMARLWKKVGSCMSYEIGFGNEGRTMFPESMYDGEQGERYNKQACEKVVDILRKVRAAADEAKDPAEKKKLDDQASEIIEIIKTMMGAEHACNYCFAQYGPGDKFCPNCGRPVEEYGVCPKCGNILGPGDKFCPKCGEKIPIPKSRKVKSFPSRKPEPGKSGK
jgi:RNA polymerase subunit RPABC4/transcription elongation factor Spt4